MIRCGRFRSDWLLEGMERFYVECHPPSLNMDMYKVRCLL